MAEAKRVTPSDIIQEIELTLASAQELGPGEYHSLAESLANRLNVQSAPPRRIIDFFIRPRGHGHCGACERGFSFFMTLFSGAIISLWASLFVTWFLWWSADMFWATFGLLLITVALFSFIFAMIAGGEPL